MARGFPFATISYNRSFQYEETVIYVYNNCASQHTFLHGWSRQKLLPKNVQKCYIKKKQRLWLKTPSFTWMVQGSRYLYCPCGAICHTASRATHNHRTIRTTSSNNNLMTIKTTSQQYYRVMILGTLIWQTNNRDKRLFQSVYPASWQNISAAWREQHDRECFSKISCLYYLTASIHLKKTKRRLVSVISKYKTARSELKTEPGSLFFHIASRPTRKVSVLCLLFCPSVSWK